MTNFGSRRTSLCILIFLLVATVPSAFAQHAAKGKGQTDGEPSNAAQKADKFRAPTPEELQILTADMAKNDSTEGLTEKTTANGAIAVDLQGRFENFSLATIDKDGKLILGCATTAKQAREFYTVPPKKQTRKPAPKPASDPSTWEVK